VIQARASKAADQNQRDIELAQAAHEKERAHAAVQLAVVGKVRKTPSWSRSWTNFSPK
jgi:hypothetical protein